MSMKLNATSKTYLSKQFERSLRALREWSEEYKAVSNPSDLENVHYQLANASIAIGLIYYQQGDSSEALKHLRIAAVHSVKEHLVRGLDLEEGRRRNAWSFFKAINLGIAFGDEAVRREIARVEEVKYRYPLNEIKTQLLSDYISVAKQYISQSNLDTQLAHSVEGRCRSNPASKEEIRNLLPMINGLLALNGSDQTSWRAAIQEGLNHHITEAKIGDLRTGYRGFIYMGGLALAKLGLEKGWTVDIDSPYLPISLLE